MGRVWGAGWLAVRQRPVVRIPGMAQALGNAFEGPDRKSGKTGAVHCGIH